MCCGLLSAILLFALPFGSDLAAQSPTPAENTAVVEDPNAAAAADLAKRRAPGTGVWDGTDTPALVDAAVAALPETPPGPFQPTWESLRANFQVPEWFRDGKFGIMMHWGVYSVPAHQSEWYERYMYGNNAGIMRWHTEHFGPPDRFGYKDFIPMFTAAKWDPDAWARLFKKAGARYVFSSGEHHDGFSNWDSAINRYNAKNMGPKRDLVGELATALKKAGLKTGVANHSNNHFTFVPALPGSDQYDPAWAPFYSVADRGDAARVKFLETWVIKNEELVDKYQPDMLWLDMNGSDRSWDPLKLRLAAYYYNRAAAWGKQVAISAKGASFLSGMVIDFERQGRAPKGLTGYTWQPDDPITDKFGYVAGQPVKPAGEIIPLIVVNVSRNGNYLLNISPMADGTIPEEQQRVLLAIGQWLDVNGEAIYGTRPWKISEEGRMHFTTKGDSLYAISLGWPAGELVIPALGREKAPERAIERVELLGHRGNLEFVRGPDALRVKMPTEKPCDCAYSLKISGLELGK